MLFRYKYNIAWICTLLLVLAGALGVIAEFHSLRIEYQQARALDLDIPRLPTHVVFDSDWKEWY